MCMSLPPIFKDPRIGVLCAGNFMVGTSMYIVGGLSRAHGGRVTIEDAPGGGARVTTTWPVGETG